MNSSYHQKFDAKVFDAMKIAKKRSQSDFPFGSCKICGDESTGIHYGVASCEGCKGFFKRSTLQINNYECLSHYNCILTKENRNKCKACRLLKCLKVGMSIENSKMGRIPNAEKERALEELNKYEKAFLLVSNDNFEQARIKNNKMVVENKIHSEMKNFLYTEKNSRDFTISNNEIEFINSSSRQMMPASHLSARWSIIINNSEIKLQTAIKQLNNLYRYQNSKISNQIAQANIFASLKIKNLNGSNASLKDVWVDILKLTERNACFMMHFLKNVFNLEDFKNSNDIKTIINHRIFDFYVIFNSLLHINGESYVVLPDGIYFTRKWNEIISGKETTYAVFEFCEKFNALKLTDCEKAILLSIVMTDYVDELMEKAMLRQLHEFYLRALKYEMKVNKRNTDFIKDLSQVLDLLSNLHILYQKNIKPLIPIGILKANLLS